MSPFWVLMGMWRRTQWFQNCWLTPRCESVSPVCVPGVLASSDKLDTATRHAHTGNLWPQVLLQGLKWPHTGRLDPIKETNAIKGISNAIWFYMSGEINMVCEDKAIHFQFGAGFPVYLCELAQQVETTRWQQMHSCNTMGLFSDLIQGGQWHVTVLHLNDTQWVWRLCANCQQHHLRTAR